MKSVYSTPDEVSEELAFAIDAAELGIWDLNPITNTFKGNTRLKEWFGLRFDQDVPLDLALAVIAREDRDRVADAIWQAMKYESGGQYDVVYTIIHPHTKQERVVRAKGRTKFGPDGAATRFNGILQDITEQHRADQIWRESETYLRRLTDNVPVIIWETAPDGFCTYLNQQWYETTGQTPQQAEGYGWLDATHPDDKAEAGRLFIEANTQRVPFSLTYRLHQRDGSYRWAIDKASPRFSPSGEFLGMVGTVVDVHEEITAHQQLEESEARFRSLVEQAPVATGLYVGPESIIELANETMLAYWGKEASVIGMPLAEALPELKDQPFLSLLDDIRNTGKTYHFKAARADLVLNGTLGTYYFDYTYKPLFTETGEVYGVLNMAVDVTAQVLSRQQIEETEATLRGAIELAELGTWSIDAGTLQATYSDRIRMWFGFTDQQLSAMTALGPIHEHDRARIENAIKVAIQPDSSGIYDEEYRIIDQQTGQERVIHAQGRTTFDERGQPIRISGTAQDVTKERRAQQELERLVQERTQQLQTLVRDLERSNANLQQFAYVASHDLQEPLRKIRSFGTLLATNYAPQLGDGVDLLDRMQNAASRMSTLISDLLAFSRISTRQEKTRSVSLTHIVEQALGDLDLRIQETGATITIDPLPIVQGDPTQLGQLFQNLLNNALKFRQPDIPPQIQVRLHTVAAPDLPPTVRPTRPAGTYHRIDVQDNGIGFDEKYLDRIFQVFQRLHGRSQYAGTGIGLAISEKVVANHGGAIVATSQPNVGTTFSVYLPVG